MVERDRLQAGVALAIALPLAALGLSNDPIGIGSEDFYFFTAMGVAMAGVEAGNQRGLAGGLLVGTAIALGGLLIGLGTLPGLSGSGGGPVAPKQLVSAAGLVLFVGGVAASSFRWGASGSAESE